MNIKIEMQLGIDVAAYVDTELLISEEELVALKANPVAFFESKLDRNQYVFEPSWENEDGFRVVGVSIGTETLAEDVWLHRPPVYEVGLMALGIVREHGVAIEHSNLPQDVKERLLNLVTIN